MKYGTKEYNMDMIDEMKHNVNYTTNIYYAPNFYYHEFIEK